MSTTTYTANTKVIVDPITKTITPTSCSRRLCTRPPRMGKNGKPAKLCDWCFEGKRPCKGHEGLEAPCENPAQPQCQRCGKCAWAHKNQPKKPRFSAAKVTWVDSRFRHDTLECTCRRCGGSNSGKIPARLNGVESSVKIISNTIIRFKRSHFRCQETPARGN